MKQNKTFFLYLIVADYSRNEINFTYSLDKYNHIT